MKWRGRKGILVWETRVGVSKSILYMSCLYVDLVGCPLAPVEDESS